MNEIVKTLGAVHTHTHTASLKKRRGVMIYDTSR